MRRSQLLRDKRASLPAGPPNTSLGISEELGTISESGPSRGSGYATSRNSRMTIDSSEATLRSEIFEKERENDKLVDQLEALHAQLAQRPPLSTIQEIENEKKTLEMILLGTQRENEKMMTELERGKRRERALEQELRKLVGENWQAVLNFTPIPDPSTTPTLSNMAARPLPLSNTFGSPPLSPHPPSRKSSAVEDTSINLSVSPEPNEEPSAEVTQLRRTNGLLKAQLEQTKLLILGMDKRLTEREGTLTGMIERAEKEKSAFEDVRKDVAARRLERESHM